MQPACAKSTIAVEASVPASVNPLTPLCSRVNQRKVAVGRSLSRDGMTGEIRGAQRRRPLSLKVGASDAADASWYVSVQWNGVVARCVGIGGFGEWLHAKI